VDDIFLRKTTNKMMSQITSFTLFFCYFPKDYTQFKALSVKQQAVNIHQITS